MVEAAGDIARRGGKQAATARILLRDQPDVVLTLGDGAYPQGSLAQYRRWYAPTWGRVKARTHPVPGNHEYKTRGAGGYLAYFGSAARPPGRTFYSFETGGWHLIALDSNRSMKHGSPQERWLRNDLSAARATGRPRCIGAYWHHPRFSSGSRHGGTARVRDAFADLRRAGAAFVLSGHEHSYERFAPQTAGGQRDPAGVRQFVVGTGGAGGAFPFGRVGANSEARIGAGHYGVLRLVLGAGRYSWKWVGVAGENATDTGSASCQT